jgi:hypothetical protein
MVGDERKRRDPTQWITDTLFISVKKYIIGDIAQNVILLNKGKVIMATDYVGVDITGKLEIGRDILAKMTF